MDSSVAVLKLNAVHSSVPSITMVRVSRRPFPQFGLPAGFSFAWYQPGCEHWWHHIQLRSDLLTRITHDLFWRAFGAARGELPRRQCYLLDASHAAIGTATAWFDPNYRGEPWGRLHWVAILPEYQGRGLAKALLTVVCERLRELHPDRAFLRTAPQRLPAIQLYQKFGFVPEIHSTEDRRQWSRILSELRGTALRRRSA